MQLPLTLGAKKLYLEDFKIGLLDADGSNYIDRFLVYRVDDYNSATSLIDDGANKTTPADVVYTPGSPLDVSAGIRVHITIYLAVATANLFDMVSVAVKYYYDD